MTEPTPWPGWFATVRERAESGADLPYFSDYVPPPDPRRESAVLMLFGAVPGAPVGDDGVSGVEVILTERAAGLRSHASQVSFPGGQIDPGDGGPVAAALREAEEEVGLDAAEVDVALTLPALSLAPSGNSVVPVLGWWHTPSTVHVRNPVEVARVDRVRLSDLLDPEHRFIVTSPRTGFRGPGFEVDGLFVWGFTALLLANLFVVAGIDRPWDETRVRELPRRMWPQPAELRAWQADEAARGRR